jgi:(S)-sulfolactate dehydrogenase
VWQATPSVLAGKWPRNDLMLTEASGKRLGLVGFGTIARLVAVRAQALGMDVAACARPDAPVDSSWNDFGVERLELDALLETSTVVSLHASLTNQTRHLIDARALARMQPGALLINSSRGALIDEAALREALIAGRLRVAILDAFEIEPVPPNSPWVGVPNLLLTPHISGVTVEANKRVSAMAVAAVRRALRARA